MAGVYDGVQAHTRAQRVHKQLIQFIVNDLTSLHSTKSCNLQPRHSAHSFKRNELPLMATDVDQQSFSASILCAAVILF